MLESVELYLLSAPVETLAPVIKKLKKALLLDALIPPDPLDPVRKAYSVQPSLQIAEDRFWYVDPERPKI